MSVTKIWIGAILVVLATGFFIGFKEALWLAELYLGVAFLTTGILMMSSVSFREMYYRVNKMNDPEWERVHTEKEKRIFDKYYFPFRGIMGGAGAILLYYIVHQQVFAAIGAWFARVF